MSTKLGYFAQRLVISSGDFHDCRMFISIRVPLLLARRTVAQPADQVLGITLAAITQTTTTTTMIEIKMPTTMYAGRRHASPSSRSMRGEPTNSGSLQSDAYATEQSVNGLF